MRSCRISPSTRQPSFFSASFLLRTVSFIADSTPSNTHTAAAASAPAFFITENDALGLEGAPGTRGSCKTSRMVSPST